MIRGLSADVYFNVGLITIIGLAAKNAILIVEFAIELEAEGKSPMEATLEAVKLRLRPIIMTSLAFVGGMVPLFIATGAGAASRIAVGTGVVGGMLAATGFGIRSEEHTSELQSPMRITYAAFCLKQKTRK